MSRPRALAACLALAVLPGCTVIERVVPAAILPGAAPAQPSGAAELLGYLARLRGLSEAALASEATQARQAAARAATDLAYVKAALALSLARDAEDADIAALVEPVMKRDAAEPGLRGMASFLHMNALERRRLRESAATARAALRDERRVFEAQKQRAETLQERAAQLQQKIDALTALEKSLSDRQAPTR